MANIFRKNLYLCFSKIKCLPTNLSPPLTIDDDEEDDYTLFPSNPSCSVNTSSFFLKNFNSLYSNNDLITSDSNSNSNSKSLTSSDLLSSSSSSDEYSDDNYMTDIIPDFSSVFASERFFFSTPGNSNSIVESPKSLPAPELTSTEVVSGGVAIQTYSPDPFADFRKSMQEMVEAHGKADWEFMHELLSCYLNLNPKHTHKFIIGAFTDLIVSLMSATTAAAAAAGSCLSNVRDNSDGGDQQNCSTSQPLV
ncbi:OLC1v1020029C1 [Oldenlandia corymbosa var. corymbosa]|uniref:Transcription repressor n=1 Tax=Oldenlandia corymbosa var. corymbosa TaxID=529605 RepID=A0AAV1EFD2_OLDCO|nr:OLC1v1020029C1 [Oldenlandia corymbosa var. corymbosa]